LWQAGGNMGAYIGSSANPSSLVSANTTRLDSWWFEQALLNNKLYVRAGQVAGLDFYGVQADGASYILEPLGYAIGSRANPAGICRFPIHRRVPGACRRDARTRAYCCRRVRQLDSNSIEI
jgi:hypothetical protein